MAEFWHVSNIVPPYGQNLEEEEYVTIQTAIKDAPLINSITLDSLYNMDSIQNVITTITKYATGVILRCCNDTKPCKNMIVINNMNDLYEMKDCEQNSFYCYKAKGWKSNRIRVAYGMNIRIFCNECINSYGTNETFGKCDSCNMLEFNIKYYDNGELYSLCPNHPFCDLCNLQDINQMIQCYHCHSQFCINCGIKDELLCKKCVILQEYEMIYHGICEVLYKKDIISELNIIEIIANYTMGYCLNCCNYSKCNQELNIANKHEFYCNKFAKTRRNTQYLYKWYSIDKQQYDFDTYWYIYSKEIRVFCKNCISTFTFSCLHLKGYKGYWYPNCENKEICPDVLGETICKAHPFCELCFERQCGWIQIAWMDYYDGDYYYEHIEDQFEQCDICGIFLCVPCSKIHYDYHEEIYYNQFKYDRNDYDTVFRRTCKMYSLQSIKTK